MKTPPDMAARRSLCTDVQPLLLAYLSRELGPGRSDLVREHIHKCSRCQAEAASIQKTIGWLRASSRIPQTSLRLSPQHRARIVWALSHPILDWVAAHHTFVSLLTAGSLILTALLLLWWWWLRSRPSNETVESPRAVYSIRICVPTPMRALQDPPTPPEGAPLYPGTLDTTDPLPWTPPDTGVSP